MGCARRPTKPTAPWRCFPRCSTWRRCGDCGLTARTSCLHVKRDKQEKREQFLSAEKFRRLAEVLEEILKDGPETHSAVVVIRLLMLTGCHLSEIQKLRWEHVDLDASELRLPGTKIGGRAVPLAPPAVRLLTGLPRRR